MIEFQKGTRKCRIPGYGKTIIARRDMIAFNYPESFSEKARDTGIMIAGPALPGALA